jgi:hypothetical protein
MAEVRALVTKVDKVLAHHHMRTFFRNPVPHVSIMSWAGDQQAAVQSKWPQIQQLWSQTVGALHGMVRCTDCLTHFHNQGYLSRIILDQSDCSNQFFSSALVVACTTTEQCLSLVSAQ